MKSKVNVNIDGLNSNLQQNCYYISHHTLSLHYRVKYKILTHSKHRSAFFSVFLFTNSKYVSYTKCCNEHMLRDVCTIFKLSIRLCSNSFQTSIRRRFSSLIGCVLHFCLVDLLCCVSLQNDFFQSLCRLTSSIWNVGAISSKMNVLQMSAMILYSCWSAACMRCALVSTRYQRDKRQVRQSWTRCCH